jgi:putative SOS response-associated peptidase YedK
MGTDIRRPANLLVAPIHDRMLAILPNNQFARWLSAEDNRTATGASN